MTRADCIIENGRVLTMDDDKPDAEAVAILTEALELLRTRRANGEVIY